MIDTLVDFSTIAITFPAAPFTLAILFSTSFWLVSILGGLDFGADGADGALDGALDGADGALDGAADGAADGLADAVADGATDGLADGADGGSDTIPSFRGSAFASSALGLGRVPITIWVSLFSLWGWSVAFVGGGLLRSPWLDFVPTWTGNLAVLAAATVAGVGLARVTSRPLEPVYASQGARKRSSLVGETAEITTSRVDGRFGQARIEIGGDDLVVQVRCDRANPLVRGRRALVVQFDPARDAFVVEPLSEAGPAGRQRRGRATARDRITDQEV